MGASISYKPTVAAWMVLAHFLKRDAEVLFLHKYSGDTDKNTAVSIGIYYAINSLMICLVSNPLVFGTGTGSSLGPILFAVGLIGNFYHHFLLAMLRSEGTSKSGTKESRAPRGGFF